MIKAIFSVLTGIALIASSALSWSQEFPTRAVRVVVPYSAGGPADIVARMLAQRVTKQLGQPVIIDNKLGAGGAIGLNAVASAAPDGYVLLFTASPTFTISPHITRSLPYDVFENFTPLISVLDYANVLIVNSELPVNSVTELVNYAKANPGKVTFSSAGVGTSNHLAGELLATATGTKLVHVPYKGNAPATMAVTTNEVTFFFDAGGTAMQQIKGGRVKGLAVTSAERNRMLPKLPTMMESGISNFEVVSWYAFFAPAKLPDAIGAKLIEKVKRVMAEPSVSEELAKQAFDVRVMTGSDFAARLKKEYGLYAKVVRDANVQKQ